MNLCHRCRAISSTFLRGKFQPFTHQPSLTALQSSADHGCNICRILLWGIRERVTEIEGGVITLEFDEIILSAKLKPGYGKAGHIMISITNQEEIREDLCIIARFVVTEINDDIHTEGLATVDHLDATEEPTCQALKVAERADSDEVFKLIRAWIDNCLNNHYLCKSPSTHTPTRLIDVGYSDYSSPLRLVEHAGSHGSEVTYLALSHCWGNIIGEDLQKMITTSTNLSRRLIAFSLQSLPQSFRDAVHITRRLGVRYLWIDSLCIMQDSDDDWQRESSVMGLIYQNALCTITANTAKGPHGGIFHPREVPPPVTIIPQEQDEDGAVEGRRTRVQISHFLHEWQTLVARSPLTRRGWTLQESHLSRRLIQFTTHEVCWECGCSSASESQPSSALGPQDERQMVPGQSSIERSTGPILHRQTTMMIKAWAALSPTQERDIRMEMGDVNPESPYQGWYHLVMDFSHRALTKPADALPALAGISTDLAGQIHDRYLAGLWEKDLLVGLGWTTDSSLVGRSFWAIGTVSEKAKSACSRPAVWRAPSWSWACVSGGVQFPFEFPNSSGLSLEVLEVSTTPVSSINPMGAISQAFLRVRGFVLLGYLGKLDCPEWSLNLQSGILYDTEEDEVNYRDSLIACLFLHSCALEGPIGLALVATGVRKDEYRRIGWMVVPRRSTFDRKVITIV